MNRFSKRPLNVAITALATAAVATAGIGVAHAYWTAPGSGATGAGSATMQTVTVDAFVGGDAPNTTLYPGGTADVILRIDNPNAFDVTIASVTGNGPITAQGGIGSCTTTGVTFANQPNLADVTVAASSEVLVHLPAAATMSTSSPSGCQGATFAIPVTVTARR